MNFFIQSMDFFLRMDFCTRKTNIFVWRRDMSLLVGESSVLTNGFLYSKERRFHRASRRNFYTANPRRLHSAAQGLFLSGERKRLRAASEGLLYWAEGQIDVANFPPAGFGCRLLANNAGRCAAKDFVMYGVIIFGIMFELYAQRPPSQAIGHR